MPFEGGVREGGQSLGLLRGEADLRLGALGDLRTLDAVEEGVEQPGHPLGLVARLHRNAMRQVGAAGDDLVERDLHRADTEAGVVLALVQAALFVLRADADRPDPVGDPEEGVGDREAPEEVDAGARRLDGELIEAAAGAQEIARREQRQAERAHDARKAVASDRADGIVDPAALLDEAVAPDRGRAADAADRQRAGAVEDVAACGDRDEAADHAADRLFRQDHIVLPDAHEIADDAARAGGEHRVGDDMRDGGRGDDGRAAVEADPADEDDHGAGHGENGGMAGNAAHAAIRPEAAEAGTQHQAGGERHPGAGRMDDGRAGEIDEAEIGEEGRLAMRQAIAPGPVDEDRIDERRDQDGRGDVDGEPQPLGGGTGHDRRGGSAEHHLEGEEGVFARAHVVEKGQARLEPDTEAGIGPEGEAEADRRKGDDRKQKIEEVLLGDVDRVLRADEACLEQQEAHLHQEHEGRRHQDPDELVAAGRQSRLARHRTGRQAGEDHDEERDAG